MRRNSPDKALNKKTKTEHYHFWETASLCLKNDIWHHACRVSEAKESEERKKERREGKIKSKKRRAREDDSNKLSFLSFSFPLPLLSFSWLSLFPFPVSSTERKEGKIKKKKRIRKGRGKKKERKESILLSSFLTSLFFFFFFFLFLFFFPSSLSCPLLIASVLSHVASLHFENCHAKFAVFSRCISSCVSSKVFLLMYPSPARQFIQISAES